MALDHKLEDLVKVGPLTAWLDSNIPQLGTGPLRVDLVHGGYSNAIISLDRGEGIMMLRRPPVVAPPGAEKTVLREARVLAALDATNVPHPKCYGVCDDAAVIGSPFYVMELVPGWSAQVVDRKAVYPAPFDRPPYDYRIPYAVTDALVALANVDYKAIGLEDFGKPGNFLERQVDRWSSQLDSYKAKYGYAGRELPGRRMVEDWLRDNVPADYTPGIMHGDIGTTNMLFAHDAPARLHALIDWELCTIGDPLIDMGWFTSGMRDEREPHIVPDSVQRAENWPTRQELMRYYASGTGRDISNFDYYVILARFKSGCILEYKVAQAARGMLSREVGDFFSALVLKSFVDAEHLVRLVG